MDYRTDPIDRIKIRKIAAAIRAIFKAKPNEPFDVIWALETISIVFPNTNYEIVPDSDSRVKGIPATIVSETNGCFQIIIKESVYEAAAFRNNGGCRMHIMHEISHCVLFNIGYRPYFDRAYKNYELNPYESIEWQSKALAGEALIPYEETIGMGINEICDIYKVSIDAAKKRIKLDNEYKEK